MASLARREDLAGRVQMIYLDSEVGIERVCRARLVVR